MQLSDVKRITVIGAGQMGQGIAQVAAVAGFDVQLVDQNAELAARGLWRIERSLARAVEKARLTQEQAQLALPRISSADLASAQGDAELAIEAISENLSLKYQLFEQLDQLLPSHALLFSNTSSIAITKLAAATQRPAQVLGMHFMNPVPLMQLVELVRGLETSPATLELAKALTLRFEKTYVVSQDRPGFIVNRVLIPLLNEACFALQEGVAGVDDIDAAVQLGLNHPMGPLRLADLIGLDTVLSIAEVLHAELGDKYRPATLLRNLVAAGRLGHKVGRGFYDYSNDPPTAAVLS